MYFVEYSLYTEIKVRRFKVEQNTNKIDSLEILKRLVDGISTFIKLIILLAFPFRNARTG